MDSADAFELSATLVQIILEAGISPNIISDPTVAVQSSFNLETKEEEDKTTIVYPTDVAEGPNRNKIINNLIEKGGKFYGDEMTLSQAVQMEDGVPAGGLDYQSQ